jgi:hypothetical protein
MEFIKANYLNTTTQIAVNSNTGTVSNLFNRDKLYQYYSDQFANDLTTSSITITFDATTAVSRIALVDTNFKEFSIFYNGSTASTFTLVGGDTTVSSYTGNTDANKYFRFATLQVSSITINAKKTITVDQEKVLGLLVISDLELSLTKIPSAQSYRPKIVPKQVVHKLSDGGTRIHTVRRKWETQLNLDYIDATERDTLYDLYSNATEFNFAPFGTTTSWDGLIFESVWDGSFDFYEYSDNAASSGFSGKISLKETPV